MHLGGDWRKPVARLSCADQSSDSSMSADHHIDRLGPADLAAMRDLNALFARVFDEAQTYLGDPPTDAWLTGLLSDAAFFALTVRQGGRLIGGLAAYELTKFERQRREIYLYDLGVAPEFRRQGVATALIDHLRGIARDRGAWVIFVQADHVDDPAVALYSKLGQREEVLHFDIAPKTGRPLTG